jgi:hypothetical protein
VNDVGTVKVLDPVQKLPDHVARLSL